MTLTLHDLHSAIVYDARGAKHANLVNLDTETGKALAIVCDQRGNPTSARRTVWLAVPVLVVQVGKMTREEHGNVQ